MMAPNSFIHLCKQLTFYFVLLIHFLQPQIWTEFLISCKVPHCRINLFLLKCLFNICTTCDAAWKWLRVVSQLCACVHIQRCKNGKKKKILNSWSLSTHCNNLRVFQQKLAKLLGCEIGNFFGGVGVGGHPEREYTAYKKWFNFLI